MSELSLLRDLGLILVAAAAVGLLARRAHVPFILAYIVAGVLIGPLTGLLEQTSSVDTISHAGIALLLFLVGLELSVARVRDVGRVAVLAGVAQLILTGLLGWAVARGLGFPDPQAALFGLALSFSSTVIAVKLLDATGGAAAAHGRIAVGILLVQDVAVAVALAVLAGVGPADGAGALAAEASSFAALLGGIVDALLGMLALIAMAAIGVRFLLPPVLRWLGRSLEALFVGSLTWCFGFLVAAEALGLSIEIGAFVAGVGLAQIDYSHELIRRVRPLADFFLAVFFVTLGAHMEVGAALAFWPQALALSLFVLIIKPAILMALIPRFGYGARPSFLASLTLAQSSEFSFVVAALALGAGLVSEAFVGVVGLVGLLTMGTSVVLIGAGPRLFEQAWRRGWLRPFGAGNDIASEDPAPLGGHVILVGMNTLGRRLVEDFSARGDRVVAIDIDPAKLAGLPCITIQGSSDHRAVLSEAGLEGARFLVSALQIEEANNLLAYRAAAAGVPSSIHAFDVALADDLRAYGATHVMLSKSDGIRRMAVALREAGVMD
jgi:Kef-type K+ transport system membrane component KefB